MKRVIQGGLLAVIGYILSPLTWWNDLIINIPLAYVFAIPFGYISRNLFFPAMIIGYWLTNIAGFILMHQGVKGVLKKDKGYSKKEFLRDLIISIIYTALMVILILLKIIRFPLDY
jgi:hypothetical protein